MKICLIGIEIVPHQNKIFVGGLANNVIRLAKGLSHKGHHVDIITSDTNHVLSGSIITSGVTIYPVHTHGGYASVKSGTEFVFKTLYSLQTWQKDYDIIHVHSAHVVLGILPIIARLVKKVPTLFTLYSPLIQRQPSKTYNKSFSTREPYKIFSYSKFASIILKNVGNVVAVSNNIKRSLMLINLRKEVSVIPPAVDTTIFNPNISGDEKRRKLGIGKETPVILYCGNWAEWKGVEILIQSMVKVIKLFPEAKLILAWGEPYNWYDNHKLIINEMIRKLGLSNNIIEVGICGSIEKLMAISNVYVAPFVTTERIADRPLSVLEAMACGKPVVATNVGGIPEIVVHGENGFLVKPGDPLELAEAICNLLEDNVLAKKMGRKGAEYVFKSHSIEVITEKYENLYSKISNSR